MREPAIGVSGGGDPGTGRRLKVADNKAPGATGVENPLFTLPNTMMLFGDARKVLQQLLVSLREA